MIRLFLVAFLVGSVVGDCPPSNFYGPCLCIVEISGFISLQCTGVIDGDQLTEVFDNVTDSFLSSVDINNSPLLTDIPDDLFEDKSVKAFRIRNTAITEAQSGLVGDPSADTLVDYLIRRNDNMVTLDGEVIADLTVLSSFECTFNGITSLTSALPVSPVKTLAFSNNKINRISGSFFKQATSISSVDLAFNDLTTQSLVSGCFDFAAEVQMLTLDLSWNNITDGIPQDALQATIPCQLYLTRNGITNFDSSTYSVLLTNMFTEYGSGGSCFVALDNNSLNCDCSIAWLINSNLVDMIADGATCSDGRLLSDLTTADFASC